MFPPNISTKAKSSLKLSHIPDVWRRLESNSFQKQGKRFETFEMRPISHKLLIFKIMEKILINISEDKIPFWMKK